MTDLYMHRCRFVPYQPSAINALALSHPRARTAKHAALARLAIGRANGDIEIWSPAEGTWHQELIIRGGKDRSVDGLVWVTEPDQDLGNGRTLFGKSRLFSVGYTSTVTEWDLEKGKPRRHAAGQHGDIWCMAAQPVKEGDASQGTKLVCGTMEGELVMYTTEDDDLRFQRTLVKSATKKAQMVSIAFQSRKVAIVGCSDSTIRVYDMSKGHMFRRMNVGADTKDAGAKDIIVWAVKCLPNGNIVSGDSTGQVCIWDGKTYTYTQRMASHKADVLSLAVSHDGQTILSGGMDKRTVVHKVSPNTANRWAIASGRRYHSHDVKAMASFESAQTSVVITGGADTHPVVMPLRDLDRNYHRTLSNLPSQPPLASAPKARFLISWWDRELHIWVIQKSASSLVKQGEKEEELQQNRKLLKTVVIKGDSNITSATINPEGTLLVISTMTDIKAFALGHDEPIKPADLQLYTLDVPLPIAQNGGSRVILSPDSKWLSIIRDNAKVSIVEIKRGKDGDVIFKRPQALSRISRDIPRYILNGGLGKYDRTITQSTFSPDSKMFAVADIAGYIDTWSLVSDIRKAEEEADGFEAASDQETDSEYEAAREKNKRSGWAPNPNGKLIPKLPASPVVLSFSPEQPVVSSKKTIEDYTLLAITTSWHILAFHPSKGQLTEWSRHNPRKVLPLAIRDNLDHAQGALWQKKNKVWVHGHGFLFVLDMNKNIEREDDDTTTTTSTAAALAVAGSKRKRPAGQTSGGGGKMARGENLAPHSVSRHVGGATLDVDIEEEIESDLEAGSDDEMDAANGEVADLRDGNKKNGGGEEENKSGSSKRSWWMTHKYRPILGVVPVVSEREVEMVLVERPSWEVDVGDSYVA